MSASVLKDYQQRFINIALESEALCFGEFTLKSGRKSPYFFNAGKFNTARALYEVGACYAAAIQAHFPNVSLLFGPAYKGIPLVSTTAGVLFNEYQRDINCAFNRKEEKKHGEGGRLMGANIEGDILIIDDVITAGTAVREVFELLDGCEGTVKGLLIGLNRQEQGPNGESAITELEKEYGININSIIAAQDLITHLEQTNNSEHLEKMQSYLAKHGC